MTTTERPTAAAAPGLIELQIGAVAHGGHCVARHEGRVVFVRHTLPGERVLARLTDSAPGAAFWRADAVEVLEASPDRVPSPCAFSGPDACGGCDWQHVALPAQRELKAAVVAEQLQRLAGLDPGVDGVPEVVVEAVPGDTDGLAWRTRMRFAIDDQGRAGLRKHRSHDVVPIPVCPISHPQVQAAAAGDVRWPGPGAVEVITPAAGSERLMVVEPNPPMVRPSLPPLPGATSVAVREPAGLARVRGRTWVSEQVVVAGAPQAFRVTGTGFWQVHPGAAQALLDAVLDAAQPEPGDRIVDLYSGGGLFAAGLAASIAPGGLVVAVESDARSVADARRSLHDFPQIRFETGDVEHVLPRLQASGGLLAGDAGAGHSDGAEVVVLDPPRAGAGRAVMEQIAGLAPRVIVYVACDPAALARDVATAAGLGYRLTRLRCFDQFPMTHHVECVATLTPSSARA
jgi:tRNA/tmRNA/rRNA uracil-C5-methylase (TrmA/RlmC/RlmD family)